MPVSHLKEHGLEHGGNWGGSELGAGFLEKFNSSAKGLRCHRACTRAGTEGQLLAFLWCSIIKVICLTENFAGLIYLTYLT